MARRAKRDDSAGESARRGNGYDPDMVRAFVERVETLKAEERELKDAFKREKLDPLKEDVDAVITEAHAAGIPKKELKRKLRSREYQRRAEAEREKLTSDEQDNYDNISQALGELGDLPLGQHALNKHGNGSSAHT